MLEEFSNINSKIYLYCGYTDMRKGIAGLSLLANEVLPSKLSAGALFVFRGKRSDRVKMLWWDGQGFCLYYKCLDKGKLTWPSSSDKGTVRITRAQLSMLKEGIDWRNPTWSCGPEYFA